MLNTSDCDWLAEHSYELSIRYPDKWIAVRNGEVIGVGETLLEANQQAAAQRPAQDNILEQILVCVDLPGIY